MFKNLFKNKETVVVLDEMDNVTVEEIHNEFNTAADKNLEAALLIINGMDTSGIEKAKRLEKLGFGKSEVVIVSKPLEEKLNITKGIAETIQEYQQKYPNYKFISKTDVIRICEKYKLVCGPIANFIADVPMKNILEMENFKVDSKDTIKEVRITDVRFRYNMSTTNAGAIKLAVEKGKSLYTNKAKLDSTELAKHVCNQAAIIGIKIDTYELDDVKSTVTEQPFLICAPMKDFDLTDLSKNGAFLVKQSGEKIKMSIAPVPDPVVLKQVSNDGYLIATAWGDEASDPLIINEKLN